MYEKLNFENGQVLTAEALNHMEDGIEKAGIGDAKITFDLSTTEAIKETFDRYNLARKAGSIISCCVKVGPSDSEYHPVLLGVEDCGEFVGHRLTFVALGISASQGLGEGFFHPKAKLSNLTCVSYIIPQDGEVNPLGKGPLLIADEELNPDSTMPIANNAIYNALTEYAKKTELPTKVSQLSNDSNFVAKKDIPTPDWNASTYKEGHIKNRTHHMQEYMCHYFKGSPIKISKPSGVGYVLLAYDTDLADKFIRIEISADESKTHEFLDAMGLPLIFTWDAGNSTINVESFTGAVETYGMRAYYSSSAKSFDEYFVKLDKGFIPEGDMSQKSMVSITYAELVVLRERGQLTAGTYYRITDYETTTTQANTRSAGHPFDVIVLALSENTLAEEAYAVHSARDTAGYFQSSKLSAWRLWYSLDNDAERFAWAIDFAFLRQGQVFTWNGNDNDSSGSLMYEWEASDGAIVYTKTLTPRVGESIYDDVGDEDGIVENIINGKGVIYRMIDEWNNDCPYDFKNIQFKRGVYDGGGIAPDGDEDGHIHLFTFSFRTEDNDIIDTSIFGNNGRLLNDEGQITGVYGNVIGQYMSYDGSIENPTKTTQRLNDIVFYSHYDYEGGLYYGCYSNTFGNSCYSNSFGNSCNSNSFGNSCYSNSFGNDCNSNSFGNNCYYNSFGNDCHSNTFGNGCRYNSFNKGCNSNTFGNGCRYNSFNNGCNFVEIENTSNQTVSLNSNNEVKVFNLADLADLLNN